MLQLNFTQSKSNGLDSIPDQVVQGLGPDLGAPTNWAPIREEWGYGLCVDPYQGITIKLSIRVSIGWTKLRPTVFFLHFLNVLGHNLSVTYLEI